MRSWNPIFHLLLLMCGFVPPSGMSVILKQAEVARAETTPQPHSNLMQQVLEGWSLAQQGKLEEARRIFDRTMQAAKQRGERDAEAVSIAGFGIIYSQQRQREKALEVYQQALKLAENAKFPRTKSMILILLGKEYVQPQQLPRALELFQQALSVSQGTLEPSEKAWLLRSISGVYAQLGQYNKNVEFAQQALEIYISINRPDAAIEIMRDISWAYREQKQYENALQYLTRSLKLLRSQPQPNSTQEKTIELDLAETQKLYGEYLLRSQGKAQAAIAQYQQSLKIAKKYSDRSKEVFVLNAIGMAWDNLGEYAKAINFYQQSLAALKLVDTKQVAMKDIRTTESMILTNLGNINEKWADNSVDETTDAKYNQAQEYFRQAAAIYRDMRDRGQEVSLEGIARIYTKQYKYEKAMEFYQQALVISQASNDNMRVANTLNVIGIAWQDLTEFDKAVEFFQKALAALKQVDSKQVAMKDIRTTEGVILTNIANVYGTQAYNISISDKERYEKAVKFYQQALAIYRDLRDRQQEVALLTAIAKVYSQQPATSEKAVKLYQQIVTTFLASKDDVKAANMLDTIGQTYLELLGSRFKSQEYATKALEFQQQALAIYQKLNDRPSQLKTLRWIQTASIAQGNYFKALEAYRQALAVKAGRRLDIRQIFNPVVDRKTPPIAESTAQTPIQSGLNDRSAANLGGLLDVFSAGNYGLTARLFYFNRYAPPETDIPSNAKAYMDILRTAYWQMQGQAAKTSKFNPEIAEIIFQRMLGISYEFVNQVFWGVDPEGSKTQRRDDSISHPFLSTGLLYLQQGDVEAALEFYQKALVISREFGDRATEGNVLSYLGQVYDAIDKPEKALEYYRQALVLLQESNDSYGKETALAQMGQTLLKSGNPSVAEKALDDSMKLWEASKTSWVSKAIAVGRRLSVEEDASSSYFYATREQIYHYLQRALIAQKKYQAALEVSERARAQSLIRLLIERFQNPDGKQPKQVAPLPDLIRIQQIAKAQNATLVEYSLIQDVNSLRDSMLYIWVIQPNGQIAFRSVDLKTLNTPLENLVTISRNAIGARGRSEVEVVAKINPQEQKTRLQKLHELLIAPIADLLPQDSKQRVILIPQGNLYVVPFAALQDATGKYLLEKHTLLLAPSIQVLELIHKKRPGGKNQDWSADNALIVGNPTMPNLSSIDPKLKSLRLGPLPAAAREAKMIAQLLNTQPLLGSQATEVEVVRRMKTARLIHLATHGLLDSLLESFKANPSRIPGAIALAPSGKDKTNNGLLTTQEISSLQLNADLVVLSACDTGRGEVYGGDSVIGLSRSFFAAGVPSIIVSLWTVPDAPTGELMTEFYKQHLQNNLDKAQALRQAMLTIMKTHPNPKDWAGFTLIGEAE